jgi:hypothetical protein
MNAQPEPTSPKDRVVGKVELVVALFITLWCAVLNFTVLQHAGGMWRDEVSSVFVASRPSLWETLSNNGVDSFPAFFSIPFHAWIAAGLGSTDFGLRVFALIPALGIVGMLWWTVRQLGGRVPLISLVLVGLSPAFFRFASGVRAYSLGVVTLLLMVGLLWRLVERPTIKRAILAALGAVLAVQTTYFNVPMLVAVGTAAALVALRRRAWKTLGLLVAVGAVAALSMLPYLSRMQRDSAWSPLTQVSVSAPWIFSCFAEAVEWRLLPGELELWIWLALVVIAVGAFAYQMNPRPAPSPSASSDLALFGLVSLGIGIVCFFGFLKYLGQHTTVWYYVSIMALVAVLGDVAIQKLLQGGTAQRWMQVGLVAAAALWMAPGDYQATHFRWTNVDLVADKLGSLAGPNDLVVVNHWYVGATFARYYKGAAPWTAVPELSHYDYQDMRELMRAMNTPAAVQPVLDRIGRALQSGNRVWLVGGILLCAPGEVPGATPPDTGNQAQSVAGRYTEHWQRQGGGFPQQHALRLDRVQVPSADPISGFEEEPLSVVTGWQQSPPAKP